MNLVYIILILLGIYLFYKWMTYMTPEEKEIERKFQESLDDELITDPETGAKITLEQAESGHWIAHENKNRPKSREELERLYDPRERQVEEAINYLKVSSQYTHLECLPQSIVQLLDKSQILSKYDDWSYSSPYKLTFTDGFFIVPTININSSHSHHYFNDDYQEIESMFVLNIKNIEGQYFFREKSRIEKVSDRLRPDDVIEVINFECFPIRESVRIIEIKRVIDKMINLEKVEFEFIDDLLLLKNLKLISKEEIIRLEQIIRPLTNG